MLRQFYFTFSILWESHTILIALICFLLLINCRPISNAYLSTQCPVVEQYFEGATTMGDYTLSTEQGEEDETGHPRELC